MSQYRLVLVEQLAALSFLLVSDPQFGNVDLKSIEYETLTDIVFSDSSFLTNRTKLRETIVKLSEKLWQVHNIFLYGSGSDYSSGDNVLDSLVVPPSHGANKDLDDVTTAVVSCFPLKDGSCVGGRMYGVPGSFRGLDELLQRYIEAVVGLAKSPDDDITLGNVFYMYIRDALEYDMLQVCYLSEKKKIL
jgi:hypothetical protein